MATNPNEPLVGPIPVSERAVRAVLALLAKIRRDDDYANDALVLRAEEDGNGEDVDNYTVRILVDDTPPEFAPQNTPIQLDGYKSVVLINCTQLSSSTSDTVPIQGVFAQIHADVMRALRSDEQLGGLVASMTLGKPDYGFDQGKVISSTMPVTLFFWTKRGNPYLLWSQPNA